MPFVRGEFRNAVHDQVAFLGFTVTVAFVSKVRAWTDPGGALDDDVVISSREDCPLKGRVSDDQAGQKAK
jgi:hypothetical protein